MSPRSATLWFSQETCGYFGGYRTSLNVGEKAAAFVVAVCGQDFSDMGQERKHWEIDEKQATQGLLRTQPFLAFPSSWTHLSTLTHQCQRQDFGSWDPHGYSDNREMLATPGNCNVKPSLFSSEILISFHFLLLKEMIGLQDTNLRCHLNISV